MAIGDGNTITEADWQTAVNSGRTVFNSRRQKRYRRTISIKKVTLNTTHYVNFTPQDNVNLVAMRVFQAGGGAQTVTLTISVEGGDDAFLLHQSPSLTVTAPDDKVNQDYTANTPIITLIKGVAYRLTLTSSASIPYAQGDIVVEGGLRK